VLIRDEHVTDSAGRVQASVLENMLDRAVATACGSADPGVAWQTLFQPDDVVGIKSNVWSRLPTPSACEETAVQRLMEVGIKGDQISVDDRGAGGNPVFRRATALINMRPIRTHHWSGLGTLLKNYIMFTSTPWAYHGNACERLVAIWHKPEVKDKTRLNVLVMLTPLFHGIGPHHFSRKYTWPYNGLIVSRDPVAADATGARIIQAKRNAYFNKEAPISPRPHHIGAADKKFGLGNAHPERIELIKMGWQEDILI
jgi:citrate lyase gamma subunit